MATPLLQAEQLHLRFGDRVVLEDVTLDVPAGALRGIIGPNGAGKTTLFNVLTGRYRPDRGRVLFDGCDVTGLPPDALARMGIARSFQIMTLFDEFSVFENVAVALPALRARSRDPLRDAYADPRICAAALDVLDQVGLADRAEDPAKALPYGARRALEIAVALAARPRLLCLDEPTAGLGSDGRARLAALIRRLRQSVTMLVIEHDMEFLFALADHVFVIHWGQVIASGTPIELRANPWVRASGLGQSLAEASP